MPNPIAKLAASIESASAAIVGSVSRGVGYIVGFIAPFIAGGATVRAIQQASNIALPNELPDANSLLENYFRGNLTRDALNGQMLLRGYDATRVSLMIGAAETMLSVADLVNLRLKNEISEEEYVKRQFAVGVDKEKAELYLKIAGQRLDILTVMSAWRRGFFDENSQQNFFNDLRAQGWTDDRIDLLKKVTSFIPPPTDLIRFLQRDVYIPEFVERFGMDLEYPAIADGDFAKIGLDHETAMKYWRAHWELPSLTQAYEMYQRQQINEEDLRRLMRAQGVEPFWREPLINIAFQPFTRIDIRRMMQFGVLDHGAAVKAFRDIGYNPTSAEQITKFYEAYNKAHPVTDAAANAQRAAQFKGLTQANVQTAYVDGIIDRVKAKQYLQDLGDSPEIAEILLSLDDYKIHAANVKEEITYIQDLYLTGHIEMDVVEEMLNSLQLTPEKYAHAKVRIAKAKRATVKGISKAELEKFVKDGIIDAETYVKELRTLGYPEKYIHWFLLDHGLSEQEIALIYTRL